MLLALNIGLLSACRQDGGEANRKEYVSGSVQEVSAIIKDNKVSQPKNEEKIQEGLALVRLDGKYGYIDKGGKEVITCQYGQAKPFFNGFAEVWTENGWGVIDREGKEIIPCQGGYSF